MSKSAEQAAEELQAILASISTKDLVDELSKREGTQDLPILPGRKWYLTMTDEDGFDDEHGKGYGPARILVVKD